MNLKQLSEKAIEVQRDYRQLNTRHGHQPWTSAEYLQGLIGDMGDLAKLIMAKNNYRHIDDVDTKLAHELSDCLWSILILAHEFNIDLEKSFLDSMECLLTDIAKKMGTQSTLPTIKPTV